MNKATVSTIPYAPSSEFTRLAVEQYRNAQRLQQHKLKMKQFNNLHEIDVTDPQDLLDNDPAYQEFLDEVDKTPF